jgi:6-methylsalicylic acid synthase
MDSHQRLGLELAYEALENAGIQPDRLAGSDTAVYIGVDSDDYSRMLREDTYRRLRLPLWTLN